MSPQLSHRSAVHACKSLSAARDGTARLVFGLLLGLFILWNAPYQREFLPGSFTGPYAEKSTVASQKKKKKKTGSRVEVM